jgi:hypothetical protein
MPKVACFFLGAMIAALGCSSTDGGSGSVAFTTWGEDYIEQEIPAADMEDGWQVRYLKFLVNFRAITVADARGGAGASMTGSKLFDLARPGKKAIVTFPGLDAKTWDQVAYQIGPVDDSTDAAGASEADKQTMLAGGYSISIDAVATKGAVTKKYTWAFTTNTQYGNCKGDLSGKEIDGTVVTNGGTDTIELTIHGDHFYYDDLQSPDAKRRFQNIADADANADGIVELSELAARKLVDIPPEQGKYGVGSASGVHDLGAFVTALARTIGHFRGEGECSVTAVAK